VTGPLHGARVVELASLWGAWAGRTLADLGAEVIVVEPPGGHFTRSFGPFVDDQPHPDRSLWWWYYNASKKSVVIDLASSGGADDIRRLVGSADIVLEGERPGKLASLGLDHTDFRARRPELVWTSVTSHGRASQRSEEPWTDLTLSAASGVAWLNGYDDHSLPPMRGRGSQTIQIAGLHAALGTLTALVYRDASGGGQHIDVSAFAACNVTTESGTFVWLVAGETVQRQTGRHASVHQTMEVQVQAADGRYVTTGFPPQEAKDFRILLGWLDELGLRESCPEAFFLDMGIERGGINVAKESADPVVMAIFGAIRTALVYIAEHLSASEFFEEAQRRDFQCGIIFSPEEAFENPHFVARGFPTPVAHEELGREIRYPGAPFQMSKSPWAIQGRPPMVGEHTEAVLGSI
jgi:crotonobetainyl-CoA:carnitine CoA-transferase CaiB-like acyl-CoA transferase